MMPSLDHIAKALGGKVSKMSNGTPYVRAPGPGHTKGDDSLCVTIDDHGRIRAWSFSAADDQNRERLRDYVYSKAGIERQTKKRALQC
jgi:hypothetical protein